MSVENYNERQKAFQLKFFLADISATGNCNNTKVSLVNMDPEVFGAQSNENWDTAELDAKAFKLAGVNMGDTYFTEEKIDAEMKSFPWNYPEEYILSDFVPSPCNFPLYVDLAICCLV